MTPDELGIGHFKAFGDTQRIPIKPITLVFGANSAGKSSLIHALAWMHEVQRSGSHDVGTTAIGGASIDLGGYRQFVHRHDLKHDMVWQYTARLHAEELPHAVRLLLPDDANVTVERRYGTQLDDDGRPRGAHAFGLQLVDVSIDGKPLLQVRRGEDIDGTGMCDFDYVDLDHEPLKAWVRQFHVQTEDGQDADAWTRTTLGLVAQNLPMPTALDTNERWSPDLVMESRYLIYEDVGRRLDDVGKTTPHAVDRNLTRLLDKGVYDPTEWTEDTAPWDADNPTWWSDVLSPSERSQIVAALVFNMIDDVLGHLLALPRSWVESLRYLGPLRTYPSRMLAEAEHADPNWRAGGGEAWERVKSDVGIRDRVNAWLGRDKLDTKYELRVQNLWVEENLADALSQALDEAAVDDFDIVLERDGSATLDEVDLTESAFVQWKDIDESVARILRHIGDHASTGQSRLVLVDTRTHTEVSHRDVGIGISQVLPVLVEAYAGRGGLVAIEQPELHLHPALQAELGDLFIENALRPTGPRNTFLIETHSEHLILRLLRRIRQTSEGRLSEGMPEVRPEDVAVLYVEPGDRGSRVIEIPIREDGEFDLPWPKGFFTERDEELFD